MGRVSTRPQIVHTHARHQEQCQADCMLPRSCAAASARTELKRRVRVCGRWCLPAGCLVLALALALISNADGFARVSRAASMRRAGAVAMMAKGGDKVGADVPQCLTPSHITSYTCTLRTCECH